jgi:hypothetical protein
LRYAGGAHRDAGRARPRAAATRPAAPSARAGFRTRGRGADRRQSSPARG